MNRLSVCILTCTLFTVACGQPRTWYDETAVRDARPHVPVTTSTTSTTTTTTLPPTTTTTLPFEARCPEAIAVAVQVGWPTEALEKLDYVVYRESRCNVDSHNPTDPNGGSYGLTQVNGFWCLEWLQAQGILTTCEELFDPYVNLRAALAIWNRSGWHPWRV